MNLFGERLKELRGSLSLLDVERETGISKTELSRYERGKYFPTVERIKQLASFYDVPYTELRILYYESAITEPEERAIIREWVHQYLNTD